MPFETTRKTALFKDHDLDGDILQPLEAGTGLKDAGKKETINNVAWLNVVFTPPAGKPATGWVLQAHCKEIGQIVRAPLNIVGFVRTSLMLERMFNLLDTTAPWFAAAEFVIARAIIETDLTNAQAKIPGLSAAGPLQVSADEWQALLRNGGDFAKEFNLPDADSDRDDPQLQVYAAIYRMHADAKAFSKLKEEQGVDPHDRGFRPTYLSLFHAYLLNSPQAAFAIDGAESSEATKNTKMDDFLKGILKPEEVDRLFAARENYLGKAQTPKTVGQFVEKTEADLKAARDKVPDLIKQHAPEEDPTPPADPTVILQPVDTSDVAEVPANNVAPFAAFGATVTKTFWPVITNDPEAMVVSYQSKAGKLIGRNGRKFFADRRNGARHHVGLDVFCKDGDVVLACADGTIVNYYNFYRSSRGEMSCALFIEHDGVVINYGEVKQNAPAEFGWKIGSPVKAGQRIARVSSTDMIHFETYVSGTKQNSRWLAGGAKPSSLRNPTVLLLNLAASGERIHTNGTHSNTDGKGGKSGQIAIPEGGAGGGAKPVSINDEDLLTLARTMYGEARSQKEPASGREAVAHVVMNRLKRKHLGDTSVKDVCLHKFQFSCWNLNDPNRPKIISILPGADPVFDECCAIAERVMSALVPDNTNGATHYYSKFIAPPDWARSPPAERTVQLGSHLFFRNVP